MSRDSFALQSGERIVWAGTPFWPKLALPGVSIIAAVFFSVIYLRPPIPVSADQIQGVASVFATVILILLYIEAKCRGVTYYITDRRVVRSQKLPLIGNTQQISLSSLVRILANRRRGRGYLVFQSQDASTLTFGDLEEDPVQIKQTAERAMLAQGQNVFQE